MARESFESRGIVSNRRDATSPTVLLADEFEDARRMLAILLETQGYATAECAGGNDTVEAAEHASPDVILLSTSSHDDGLEIVHRLRRRHGGGPPIILITGFHTAEFRSRAFAAGCDGCLLIPIDFTEVLAELRRVLRSSAPPISPTRPVHESAATIGPAIPPAHRTARSEPRARVRTMRPGGRVARVEKVADHLRNRRRSR